MPRDRSPVPCCSYHPGGRRQDPGSAEKLLKIRSLNDRLRIHGHGGMWMVTEGITSLPPDQTKAVLKSVQTFSDFNPDNDPYGEHDFGAFTVAKQKYFFKISYYDNSLEYGSPDPSDPAVTTRVLTLMFASEY